MYPTRLARVETFRVASVGVEVGAWSVTPAWGPGSLAAAGNVGHNSLAKERSCGAAFIVAGSGPRSRTNFVKMLVGIEQATASALVAVYSSVTARPLDARARSSLYRQGSTRYVA